jgi:Fe2+ or Zn2+ uptake regulation protein
MSVKLVFQCNSCGAEGTIKLNNDEHEITVCPACGNCLDIEQDEEDDE